MDVEEADQRFATTICSSASSFDCLKGFEKLLERQTGAVSDEIFSSADRTTHLRAD